MPYCRRLLQADILPQKLSRRKAMVIFLGSSGVAWISTGTRRSASRKGIGNGPLFAEVRQGHDNAVDAIAIALEEVGAAPGLFPGFDRSVLAFFRSQRHHIHPRSRQHPQHFFPAAFGQMIGKEAPVAHDQAHRHFFRRHTLPL